MTGETFGQMIYRLRKQRRWTQEELAQRAFITQSSVSQVELDKGKSRTSETVQRLAAAFGADPHDWLVKAGVVPARQTILPEADPPGLYPDDLEAADLRGLFANPEVAAALRRIRVQEGDEAYRQSLDLIADQLGVTLRAIERGRTK